MVYLLHSTNIDLAVKKMQSSSASPCPALCTAARRTGRIGSVAGSVACFHCDVSLWNASHEECNTFGTYLFLTHARAAGPELLPTPQNVRKKQSEVEML